jgi:hypothetical protein
MPPAETTNRSTRHWVGRPGGVNVVEEGGEITELAALLR